MNDHDLEDEYIQEFELAAEFDNGVAIKSELGANSVDDCNGAELTSHHPHQHHHQNGHVVTTTTTTLPPISRLAPLPISSAMQSPPHHLMTPPDEGYHSLGSQQALHPVLVKGGNHLIMYSNIGTPPDTPPVSNSPPPQSGAYHLEHHHQHQQYPHIHQTTTKHAIAATAPAAVPAYIDETLWLSSHQSMDLRPRQEPLDLRHGDAVAELHQNWNVTRQHMSVITTGNRILQADYVHHHQRQVLPQQHCFNPSSLLSKPLMNGGLISPASSSGRTTSSSGRTISRHNHLGGDTTQMMVDGDTAFDDDELLSLPVRDLNIKLKGKPKEVQHRIKQRRRTLKNRGYAKNCRSKRVLEKEVLDTQNQTLLNEQHSLRMELKHAENEVTALRIDNQKLVQELRAVYRRCRCGQLPKMEGNGRGGNNGMTANQYC